MKNIFHTWFLLAILLLQSVGAKSQNTFSKIYPIDFEDGRSGMSINLLKDSYIIGSDFQSGTTTALYRIDLNGNIIWKKKYWLEFTFSDPELTVVKNDKIYLAGIKPLDTITYPNATVFACLDSNGNILWSKTFSTTRFGHEQGMKLTTDDKGFLICSHRFTSIEPYVHELVVYRLDTLGNVLNEKVIVRRTNRYQNWESARYRNGKYFLSSRVNRLDSASIQEARLYELDTLLNIIDSTTIPRRGYTELGINGYLPLRNNKRLFYWYKDTTMRVPPYKSMNQNTVLYFLDSNNVEQSRITLFDVCERYFHNMKELANGDILGVGVKEPGCFFSPPQITKSMVVRLTPTGQVKWQRYMVDSLYDPEVRDNRFFDFEEDKSGNLIISGGVINKTGGFDVWLVKLDSNGCLHHNCPNEEIRVNTFDSENPPLSIKAYPNPTSGSLTVDFDIQTTFKEASFSLTDATGREVLNQKINNGQNQVVLQTEQLNQGLYFIILKKDNRAVYQTKVSILK